MNLLSTAQAAAAKGTSVPVILANIKRGEIDAIKVGGVNLVKANKKFEKWERSERHAQAAQTRWAKKEK
jgi:hypothetical protein